MTTHGSATTREETPHENETTNTTISDAVRRQAQSIINDSSIDPQWRAVIRYGLETNDPSLPDLVQRADAGEMVIDTIDFPGLPDDGESSVAKVEALTEIICRSRDESTAALFVLMGTLQHSRQPEVLANTAKHYAFTRCGEFNIFGMVDAQIAVVEAELLGAGMETKSSRSAPTLPNVPQALSANAGEHEGEINLVWKAVQNARRYTIESSVDPAATTSSTHAGIATSASKIITNLTSGKRYWFRVAAVSAGGQSGWSEHATKVVP